MMGKGRCWTRQPAMTTKNRQVSYVENENFNDDNKCKAVGLGGVYIVQEFLSIWDDLSRHYGEVVIDSYKLKAADADRNDGAWKEKKVVKSGIEKISKKRSNMRLNRVSRESYLANNKVEKISTDNSKRRNKAGEEESGTKSVGLQQKTMLLPDLTNTAASGDHLEENDEVVEKVGCTDKISGECLSFKDLVGVIDGGGVPITNLPGEGSRQVGRLGKARARPSPTLRTKKRRKKKSKPPPAVTQPVLASISEDDSAIVCVQGNSWLGLGTLFREAFREYEAHSGAVGDSLEAVLKDENYNESESKHDCPNDKKTLNKFDEVTPSVDDDVLKVISNEENVSREDVPTEVVTKEDDNHAAVLLSVYQDNAIAKRDVDGEVIIFVGPERTFVECDCSSEDGHDQAVVMKGVNVEPVPSAEDGDESSPALLDDDGAVTCSTDTTSQVVSSCDQNNNCLKFSPSLATIIDVEEDDNSDEDDLASPAVTTVVIKHPLEHSWTFWYFYPDRNRTWEENLRTIQTVSTIEDFWAVQNWIEPPSSLQPGADYSLFKTGISPDWEDMANRKGGRWVVNTSRQEVDWDWVEVIMGMVGQQFGEEQDKQVNGAVVSTRNRGDKVAVWVREVVDSDKVGTMVNMMLGRTGVFKVHKKQIGK